MKPWGNSQSTSKKDQKLKTQFKSMEEFIGDFYYNKYWDDWEQEHPGESKEYDWGAPVGKEII